MQDVDQRCLTAVDTFSNKLPVAAGTHLMSCFTSSTTGLEFRFRLSGKLKFLTCMGNHYSIAYRFVLNASTASLNISPLRLLASACYVLYELVSGNKTNKTNWLFVKTCKLLRDSIKRTHAH